MTLDKQKVEEQSFVLRCNVSACSLNLANQNEQAWITICGHIFCANCGSAELGNIPVNCPTCSHVLTSPFDILKSQLSPPSHFIKVSENDHEHEGNFYNKHDFYISHFEYLFFLNKKKDINFIYRQCCWVFIQMIV